MAHSTKVKFAAIVTALVATFGIAGVSTAAGSDAGKAPIHHMSRDSHEWCC